MLRRRLQEASGATPPQHESITHAGMDHVAVPQFARPSSTRKPNGNELQTSNCSIAVLHALVPFAHALFSCNTQRFAPSLYSVCLVSPFGSESLTRRARL